jgi:hypothetical protein
MKKLAQATVVLLVLMLLAQLSGGLAQTAKPTWKIQKVAPTSTDWCGRGGIGGISLSVDSYGNPKICFTMGYYSGGCNGYSQMYASSNGTNWNIEEIGVGSGGSFALDSAGNPHVFYSVNYIVPTLQFVWIYSFFDGSRWQRRIVDENGGVGGCSIALDSYGNSRVIYDGNTGLRYASLIGGKWNIQDVKTSVDVAGPNSLALDSANRPHILFFDYETLEYAIINGSGWTTQVIDQNAEFSPVLVLDSNGTPHVIYNDHEALKYAVLNGTKWDIQVLSKEGYGGLLL